MSDVPPTDESAADLAWETRDSWVGYDCPGFEIRHDEVTLPDGTETDFDYLSEPPAVVVLPFTPDGDVVCIEEWRHAVGRVNFGVPVGSVEDDDVDRSTAARRELTEETGYAADRVEPLVTVEPANGIADSEFNVFVAHDCTPDGDQDLDFDESIRPTTVTYADLRAAVAAGEVRDGRTVLAVAQYELVGGR
ncbi:NUDIX hydrolase [Halomarina oriensis]|uniref:NUDIX domain-containing protein n=1 Tax=Halomarina oriensis TaxID=671145 RepID=A0A6B0GXV9_9EURY|nr:NUDIX hydrolase [Halomarina oriensis]MWG36975.1 NUDIX domain-containing protein [Halomarina oriensis]